MPEALAALATDPAVHRQALVTGNLEPIARRKLAAAGIGDRFAPGQGGFGSDAEDRAELPAIARARAGGWARERTVVIGDTPRDIACARADGVRVIAIATGPFGAADLAGADAVVDDARAVLPVLADWAATGLTTSAEPPPRRTGSAAASIRPPGRNSIPVAAPISAGALNVCPFAASAVAVAVEERLLGRRRRVRVGRRRRRVALARARVGDRLAAACCPKSIRSVRIWSTVVMIVAPPGEPTARNGRPLRST